MGGWHVASAVCGVASLVLLISSLVSDHWVEILGLDVDANAGLWRYCTHSSSYSSSSSETECFNLGMDVKAFVHATRAFMIMGLIPALIASILVFVRFFHSSIGYFNTITIVMISSHVAAIFIWAALSIFTGPSWAEDTTILGWSVISCWFCPLLLHLTGEFARRSRLQSLIYQQI